MAWDEASRRELFSKKYAPYSKSPEGSKTVREYAESDRSIRECCEDLDHKNGATCAKLNPTFLDYATDYIMDSLQRLICCQPACSLAPNLIEDDNVVELGESTTRYGPLS